MKVVFQYQQHTSHKQKGSTIRPSPTQQFGIFSFANGSAAEQDAEAPKYIAWQRNNNIVASWLLNSLLREMRSHCSSLPHCSSNLE
ncbi:hypothetical protein A2U01_0028687 [Trifolium medium]|uniref:Uncharacterized protein n=1 Tax=Trifolium medium TaxID=97028 RepID=A0A392P6E0_9FABA|nr:hypothetical protein [Trifolium medium]